LHCREVDTRHEKALGQLLGDRNATAAAQIEDGATGLQQRYQGVYPREVATVPADRVAAIGVRNPVIAVPH
jgi:hypothetical protein